MRETDIRLLILQIWQGFQRADNPPTKGFANIEAQQAYKAESDQIAKQAENAALDLAASTLCAIHRIADAQERIADVLEAGGPFAMMAAEPKPLFGSVAGDGIAAERG